MSDHHPLVQRQLRKVVGPGEELSPGLAAFAAKVNEAYREFESDRVLLERSLELSSQELVQANSEMRVVIQTFPDLFLRLDADGTIRSCRASNDKDLLLAAPETIGRRIQDVPDPAAGRAFAAALEDVRRTRSSTSLEYTLVVRDVAQIYEARLLPIHAGQVLAIIRNITERKRAEAQLVAAREAALEIARLKSEFLANMSHEIRTPMTCIIGMTELVLDSNLTSEQRDFLAAVKTSADALLGLLNDILDFSKIEAGKMPLESIPFSLRDCVGQAVNVHAIRAHQKGLKLACNIDPNAPDRLVSDPGRLRQIILNLVGNAIKFTETGEVVVDVRDFPQQGGVAGGAVRIRFEVRDTGIGIAPHAQSTIFEAFSQADGSMTRRYGGTGLGLAISRQLVELMGGRIDVSSTPGEGSTFGFTATFPLAPDVHTWASDPHASPRTDPVTRHSVREKRRRLDVLLAEDVELNHVLIRHLLEGRGHRVVAVGTGREALEAARSRHFDIVLMDVQMPDMDGLEATTRIRSDERDSGTHLPIVALTAHALAGDREHCIRAGMDGYLMKPIDSQKLFETIHNLTEPARRSDPLIEAPPATLLRFDREDALRFTGGDVALLDKVLDAHLAQTPSILRELDQLAAGQVPEALERFAHRIKRQASVLGANAASTAAKELEAAAREGKETRAVAAQLRTALEELQATLREMRRAA